MNKINATYRPFWESDARYRVRYGGAGSGKSVSIAQQNLLRAATNPDIRILTIRKVAKTCRHSTFQLYKDVLKGMNRIGHASIRETPMTISFPDGGSILHAGLDDEQKLKSISGVTHVWVEEATELDFPDSDHDEPDLAQLDLRLRGVDPDLDPSITLSFNPVHSCVDLFDYLDVDTESLPTRGHIETGDVYVQHSTHEDNPFVGEEYMTVFQRLGGSMQDIYERGEIARSNAPDQLIPYEWVKHAQEREPDSGIGYMGVDVARYGNDDTVIADIEGTTVTGYESHSGLNTTRVADVVGTRIEERVVSAENVGVDAIGIGAGVVDTLKDRGLNVVPVVSGEKPKRYKDGRQTEVSFVNLRSQMWWTLRGALQEHRVSLPSDRTLTEELCAPRYGFRSEREVKVEPKDKVRDRLGRSPDVGDAVVYAWALRELVLSNSEPTFAVV